MSSTDTHQVSLMCSSTKFTFHFKSYQSHPFARFLPPKTDDPAGSTERRWFCNTPPVISVETYEREHNFHIQAFELQLSHACVYQPNQQQTFGNVKLRRVHAKYAQSPSSTTMTTMGVIKINYFYHGRAIGSTMNGEAEKTLLSC